MYGYGSPSRRQPVSAPVTSSVTTRALQALRALGIEGPMLARAYRQLESFVVGATVFDFAGQPNHLNDRLKRISLAGDPDLAVLLRSTEDIESDNEAAFAASLNCLLDAIITQAAPHGERSRKWIWMGQQVNAPPGLHGYLPRLRAAQSPIPGRLAAGQRTLNPSTEVRSLPRELFSSPAPLFMVSKLG